MPRLFAVPSSTTRQNEALDSLTSIFSGDGSLSKHLSSASFSPCTSYSTVFCSGLAYAKAGTPHRSLSRRQTRRCSLLQALVERRLLRKANYRLPGDRRTRFSTLDCGERLALHGLSSAKRSVPLLIAAIRFDECFLLS